jgi:hypothetical protein
VRRVREVRRVGEEVFAARAADALRRRTRPVGYDNKALVPTGPADSTAVEHRGKKKKPILFFSVCVEPLLL